MNNYRDFSTINPSTIKIEGIEVFPYFLEQVPSSAYVPD